MITAERAWRIVHVVGWVLVASGLLVALFIPYQLFYTNHLQTLAQNAARTQLPLPPATDVKVTAGPLVPLAPQPEPVTGSWLGRLTIARIHLSQMIIEGVDEGNLRQGPGHYPDTAQLGTSGNAVVAGHRTTWGEPFRYLDRLLVYDPIEILTPTSRIEYRVVRTLTVAANDLSVLDPSATGVLTMVTCTPPYTTTNRLIVVSRLVSVTGIKSPATSPKHHQPQPLPVSTLGRAHSRTPVVLYGALLLLAAVTSLRLHSAHRRRVIYWLLTLSIIGIIIWNLFEAVAYVLPAGY